MDVGISRSSIGLRAFAAACLAGAFLCAGAAAALATSPPPPPPASPPPASGPTGGGGGSTTGTTQPTGGSTHRTPPPDTRAPGRVLGLQAITKTPGKITLRWSNPHASDLAGIVIRRGFAACPASAGDGVQVGGTSVRTVQVDTGAVDNTRYCYAAFAFDANGNYSRAAVDRGVLNPGDRTPPGPVTGLAVATNAQGQIVVTWQNPQHAGIAFDAVRRGVAPNCPTGPADGSPVGNEKVRASQVDSSAKPGVTYCYRVFALDASGNASAAVTGQDWALPKPAAVHHATPAQGSATSTGGRLTSTLMRGVAVAGFLMVLLMVVATIVTRRRTHSSAYARAARGQLAPARQFGPMSASGPGALVIPALAVLGCGAAVALVLLNL
ncbi:MAG TPA: fibronectin type III domain-containing protein [Gaiellales bacterium]|nr:fibronectin type III domain-containing protein [Gaiellales bacterium]